MEEPKNSKFLLQNLQNSQNSHFSRLELTEKVAIKALGRLITNSNISQPVTSRSFSYSQNFNPEIHKKYS